MDITCVDMGGSNLRIAQVRDDGTIQSEVIKHPVHQLRDDRQVVELIAEQARAKRVSICCAGDIDEEHLIIKYSSNVPYSKRLEYPRMLKERGLDVVLTNDMRAAVMGEAVYGSGKGKRRVAVATFSSGANCAVADNQKVVTSAEFGHMPFVHSAGLFCGCGQHGHLEPYVSGNGAATWAQQFFHISHQREHPLLDACRKRLARSQSASSSAQGADDDAWRRTVASITAADVYDACREAPDQEPQRTIRQTQVLAIAHCFGAMLSAYNPLDVIVLMGSQTNDWDVLFEPAIQRLRTGGLALPSLSIPPIVKTALPEIGLQGAAAYYLNYAGKRE